MPSESCTYHRPEGIRPWRGAVGTRPWRGGAPLTDGHLPSFRKEQGRGASKLGFPIAVQPSQSMFLAYECYRASPLAAPHWPSHQAIGRPPLALSTRPSFITDKDSEREFPWGAERTARVFPWAARRTETVHRTCNCIMGLCRWRACADTARAQSTLSLRTCMSRNALLLACPCAESVTLSVTVCFPFI